MRTHKQISAGQHVRGKFYAKGSLTLRWARLISFFVVAFALTQVPGPAKTVQEVTPDEYAIYSRLIQHFDLTGQPLVITSATSVDDEKELLRNDVLRHLTREFPSPSSKAIADFKAKNARSFDLDRKIPGVTSYALVPRGELDKFWDNCTQAKQDCGWDLFYSKYPSSSGIVTLSRVGFTSTGEDALVYLGNRRHWKSGTGYLVLLHKNGEEWDIVKSVVAWMS